MSEQNMDLTIALNKKFNGLECNFYMNENNDIFMTREQIGRALEYSNPRDAIYRIHERNKERLDKFSAVDKMSTASGTQETVIYNERGIYEIARYSKQPKANDFYDWVYEAIEQIRKTGQYSVQNNISLPDFTNPAAAARAWADEYDKRIEAENKVITMQPKAEYYDALVDKDTLSNFRDTAKMIGLKQKKFINLLLSNRFVYRDSNNRLKPYAEYINSDKPYFAIKDSKAEGGWTGQQTMVTVKGRKAFCTLFADKN